MRNQDEEGLAMKNTGTLQVSLPSDREIQMVRVFRAPRQLVWEAFAKPELLKRWFGPHGHSLVECEVDHRVGGGFRFVIEDPKGRRMGMRGVYEELAAPERSVHIESFDDFPGPGARVTTVFDEKDGTTTMTVTVRAESKEVRDAVLASGMEHGAAETYDRLAALLESGAA
jgi:uncharacterized protein YndB with AHSA1/START domain